MPPDNPSPGAVRAAEEIAAECLRVAAVHVRQAAREHAECPECHERIGVSWAEESVAVSGPIGIAMLIESLAVAPMRDAAENWSKRCDEARNQRDAEKARADALAEALRGFKRQDCVDGSPCFCGWTAMRHSPECVDACAALKANGGRE